MEIKKRIDQKKYFTDKLYFFNFINKVLILFKLFKFVLMNYNKSKLRFFKFFPNKNPKINIFKYVIFPINFS